MISIRIYDYGGDYDDLYKVNLAGPYPDVDTAAAEIARLVKLPGVDGVYQFEISDLSRDEMISPESIADATNDEDILKVI